MKCQLAQRLETKHIRALVDLSYQEGDGVIARSICSLHEEQVRMNCRRRKADPDGFWMKEEVFTFESSSSDGSFQNPDITV